MRGAATRTLAPEISWPTQCVPTEDFVVDRSRNYSVSHKRLNMHSATII